MTRTYYPDQVNSGTGNPIGGAKFVEMSYNLDGSLNTQTDQRGVVHTYQYDDNRRIELDRVTNFGSSGIVDQTVKSIGRTYDTLGRTTHITSYSTNNGSGTPLNQLAYTFDSYGTLTETDQEHDGAVDGSTLNVQYGYDTAASSNIFTNGLRQSSLKAPWHQANNKYLRLYYGVSGSATESRFDRLHQVSGQFEQNGSYPIADDYRYAGVNRLWTARTRWANGGANQLYLHYDGATLGDTTRGYDRFGRVIGHSTSGTVGASSFGYTYDYAGNRLTRDVLTSTNNVWDQKYAYDDLLRLAASDQGTLSSGNISSPTFEEDYALDQLGNWENLVKKTGGSTTLDQNRAHNEANETGTIGATTGTNWADPVHDDAGNMTTIPQPKSPANGYTAIYDAWNRMVEAKDGGTTVQANQYDGLHRRTVRDETGGSGAVRHFYYNENWQCVEERDDSYAFVKRHFWHPYYIDALAASIDSTGERVSFVHDANFNVTMAVDDTYNAATVIERYHYSPYGEVTYLNPDFSVKGTQESDVGNEYLYTGRRLDPGTGLQYSRYRYYHAPLGRFVTRDPIRYRGWLNLYSYVLGQPTGSVDPIGLVQVVTDPPDESAVAEMPVYAWDGPAQYHLNNPRLAYGLDNSAHVQFCMRIHADCNFIAYGPTPCEEDTRVFYRPEFTVEIKMFIHVNQQVIAETNTSLDDWYGHEQRHILMMLGAINDSSVQDDALGGLRDIEEDPAREYASHSECQRKLRRLERQARKSIDKMFNTFYWAGFNHGFGGHPTDGQGNWPLDGPPEIINQGHMLNNPADGGLAQIERDGWICAKAAAQGTRNGQWHTIPRARPVDSITFPPQP